MADNSFFNEGREQSRIKTALVSKYFDRWARIMMATQDRNPNHKKLSAYIDLFAGPGRYQDGTQSTPLVILEKAIAGEKLRERLITLFNDKDESNFQSLANAISQVNGVEELIHYPKIMNQEVGSDMVKLFESFKFPTLFFVDPWGYKRLSLKLIDAVVKDWGCDCIFFFNYNRVNTGMTNEFVASHMNALFGEQRADVLRIKLGELSPDEREAAIVEEICQAIIEMGGGNRYVLPFAFRNESGKRTSHHLIFVSKGFKGYEEMREVMAKESSSSTEGVASFEYSPASVRQPLLFNLNRPIEDLATMLMKDFAGRKLTMLEVYQEHNVGLPHGVLPYIKKNYKQALTSLLEEGKIQAPKRKKGTFGDGVEITFPSR